MATVKLDENVPDSVAATLREGGGHDVALARDEQLAGAEDARVLAVAGREGRILVSLDRDFTNVRRHPPESTPGIVVIRLHEQTLPVIRKVATGLADLLTRKPVAGRLWVIDEARLRMWPGN